MVYLVLGVILLISVVVSIGWMKVLKKFDSTAAVKKSGNSIRGFFFAGLLSVPAVFLLYFIVDPLLFSIASRTTLLYQILYVGLVEETSKFLIFYIVAVNASSIKEPRDGILYAATVGLAFAIIENILYSVYGLHLLMLRSLLGTIGHMTYAAVWGYAIGVVLYTRKANSKEYGNSIILSALVIAALFHGIYNYFLEIGYFALAISVKIITLTVALKSLSFLKGLSPYEKFPIEKYRTAIPRLEMALASNPKNFALHKRIALHYIRAGSMKKARSHLQRASRISRGELSSRFYLHLLDAVTAENMQAAEEAREKFLKIVMKMPGGKLEGINREAKRVFSAHPQLSEVKELLSYALYRRRDARKPRPGARWEESAPGERAKILGRSAAGKRAAGSYTVARTTNEQAALNTDLRKRIPLSKADPLAFERKTKAVRRIIGEKQRELQKG
jgi:protease PrsW